VETIPRRRTKRVAQLVIDGVEIADVAEQLAITERAVTIELWRAAKWLEPCEPRAA
jgi:hypothetical protein